YRVLRPGGKIVLTTPNYYALRPTLRRIARMLRRRGGMIPVRDVIYLRTLAHHWKEYSAAELRNYFALLSRDFRITQLEYTEDYRTGFRSKLGGEVVYWLERAIPPLRPDLYIEIDLTDKRHGISIEPHW